MKLIDADELMEKIYSVKYLRKIKSKQLIDECETVDAIPIEWLKKYRQKKKRMYGGVDVYSSIKNIINDWRKENEID